MMEILDQKTLENLIKKRGEGPCVSIYMPTVRAGDVSQNPIMFKNLISKAEEKLKDKNLRTPEIKKLLEPAEKLADDSVFWNNQSEGLVLFLSDEFFEYYRMPIKFDETVVVTDSFHLKPIIPVLVEDEQFYVLALSQKDARLLRGTRDFVEEMDLSDVIKRFEDKFGEELPEQYLQFHTRAPKKGETRAAVYFGHGGDISSIKKERLMHYFRFLDNELYSMLYHDGSPLILACVDSLSPLYREANNYPNLIDDRIKGNPEKISNGELHKKAWEIINPIFKQKREKQKNRYDELKGTGKTSNEIREVLPASFQGRVETLFVPLGVKVWGKYNLENDSLEVRDSEPMPNDEDLFDLAAVETYLNNGNVYAVNRDEMPQKDKIAAIYRY
ncbi:hypothetical protein [Natranaerofaba carboxydovora]|uniref:baeRF3 domain-containing protein n=1 Tax=Natranaerofaba carboxydovora TaxID=2742683 RepID=UPI001F145343|nr:hypothetical protein [Natranaerofaba carboxydovora]UMZ72583.1 hypothetical protein ACONDI_00107 [Natranaerofaba carboxydovora]